MASRCAPAPPCEASPSPLRPSSVTLFGFSQGAYLASYAALSRPDLFDRLVCCGGRPKAEFIKDLAAARSLRVLIQTGERDAAVPPDLVAKGVAPLREAGLDVTEKSYDAEHKVTAEMASTSRFNADESCSRTCSASGSSHLVSTRISGRWISSALCCWSSLRIA